MAFPPPAIIMINDDLTPQVQSVFVRQLQIDEVLTKEEWDARVAAQPNYAQLVKRDQKRVMVRTSHQNFLEDRSMFDVVLFFKNGLCSIESNKFGPPQPAFSVPRLYWGQLGVF